MAALPPQPPVHFLGDPAQPTSLIGLLILSGQEDHFLDGNSPIITVNIPLRQSYFQGRRGPHVRVGVYNATYTVRVDDTTVIVAPPDSQTYQNGHYFIPSRSLVFSRDAVANAPLFFTVEAFNEYVPAETRTLLVSWDPSSVSGVITTQTLQDSFTRVGHPIENCFISGHGKARVTFTSVYSVGSILCGQEEVPYMLGDGQAVLLSSGIRNDPDNQKILVTWDAMEVHVNYAELHNFFSRYGRIARLGLQKIRPGVEQPSYGVVTFSNAETVEEVLEGLEVVTLDMEGKEITVRVYPVQH